MLARSHRLCSIALVELGLLTANLLLKNPLQNLALLCATSIGSSLPDLDQYGSTASRRSLINFSLLLRHRGFTHSLIGWLIFSYISFRLMNWLLPFKIGPRMLAHFWPCLWLGLSIGYLLHLAEDSFSRQGVDWFWPLFKKHRRSGWHYKVGGWFEKIVATLALLAIVGMSLYWLWLLLLPEPRI